jgi:hypothetical protein
MLKVVDASEIGPQAASGMKKHWDTDHMHVTLTTRRFAAGLMVVRTRWHCEVS